MKKRHTLSNISDISQIISAMLQKNGQMRLALNTLKKSLSLLIYPTFFKLDPMYKLLIYTLRLNSSNFNLSVLLIYYLKNLEDHFFVKVIKSRTRSKRHIGKQKFSILYIPEMSRFKRSLSNLKLVWDLKEYQTIVQRSDTFIVDFFLRIRNSTYYENKISLYKRVLK